MFERVHKMICRFVMIIVSLTKSQLKLEIINFHFPILSASMSIILSGDITFLEFLLFINILRISDDTRTVSPSLISI